MLGLMLPTWWICTLASPTARAAAASASAPALSSNWSGYVAHAAQSPRLSFAAVSATWVEPAANCAAGSGAASAVWVGLGGYYASSRSLEQLGTESDCIPGRADSAWLELLPAARTPIRIAIHPGDTIAASVNVRGHSVTLGLRDLTTGARFSTTRHVSVVDTSSAEWIVEAPSLCGYAGFCRTLPLTDFGTASFRAATATLGKQKWAAGAGPWQLTALELRQDRFSYQGWRRQEGAVSGALVASTPSTISPTTGAFSVLWSSPTTQQRATAEAPPWLN
jgi:hypothetical protein